MSEGSRAARCYGATRAHEHYYRSYGIDDAELQQLLDAGLPIVGYADDGTPRTCASSSAASTCPRWSRAHRIDHRLTPRAAASLFGQADRGSDAARRRAHSGTYAS